MIPLDLLALLALAVYRGTLLVTGDRITRTPRRRLRAWLKNRSHHELPTTGLTRRCACGWHTQAIEQPNGRYSLLMAHPVPRNIVLPTGDVPEQEASDRIDHAVQWHIRLSTDTSRLGYLLECPWCVSAQLGAVAAAVAWAWPEGWWRWPALALAVSGVTGLLATIAAPDENDDED